METRMVRVTEKPDSYRTAIAVGSVKMRSETLRMIARGEIEKGDPLEVARVAGIMAAKKTSELIPLCHPIGVTSVRLDFELDYESRCVRIEAEVETVAKTGVEMEALTAVAVAALTIYDMCKGVDAEMSINEIKLVRKEKSEVGGDRQDGVDQR
ncbi:cyclic pyranopterin monophosphate synthase MoaC [Candidatus Poribacteria bacterium]|nr:MAG: cyclic pyranopterin monophosphate synthase MoaC [Candidatus Poribacteria bacterium]